MSFEEQVRERAYHIWLAGGMADGQADEHWVCAEQALRGETASAEPVVIITKAATKSAAAKPAAKASATKASVTKAKVAKAKVAKTTTAKAAAKPVAKAKAAKADAVQPTAH